MFDEFCVWLIVMAVFVVVVWLVYTLCVIRDTLRRMQIGNAPYKRLLEHVGELRQEFEDSVKPDAAGKRVITDFDLRQIRGRLDILAGWLQRFRVEQS